MGMAESVSQFSFYDFYLTDFIYTFSVDYRGFPVDFFCFPYRVATDGNLPSGDLWSRRWAKRRNILCRHLDLLIPADSVSKHVLPLRS
jgi:hypothetical protein